MNMIFERSDSAYNLFQYDPATAADAVGLVVFVVLFAAHLGLAVRHRSVWTGGFVTAACVAELIGFAARVAGTRDTENRAAYVVQEVCLAFAPTLLTCGLYVLFPLEIAVWGVQYWPLPPQALATSLVVLNSIVVVTQSVGSGLAADAFAEGNFDAVHAGRSMMMIGLILQTLHMVVFLVASAVYFSRVRRGRVSGRALARARRSGGKRDNVVMRLTTLGTNEKTLETATLDAVGIETWLRGARGRAAPAAAAVAAAVTLVLVRNVYRIVSVALGWLSYAAVHEAMFLCLDSVLVASALTLVGVFYPGAAFAGVVVRQAQRAYAELAEDGEMR
ncbi:RTA1 like protein-domain-containing protein [Dipodascopsis tothii]|uniref:RTA1 like protein-domain-containing protein n=1 Tax=Dipodascopsis tothii TaxID=44089 RepID=UPI0034CD85C7